MGLTEDLNNLIPGMNYKISYTLNYDLITKYIKKYIIKDREIFVFYKYTIELNPQINAYVLRKIKNDAIIGFFRKIEPILLLTHLPVKFEKIYYNNNLHIGYLTNDIMYNYNNEDDIINKLNLLLSEKIDVNNLNRYKLYYKRNIYSYKLDSDFDYSTPIVEKFEADYQSAIESPIKKICEKNLIICINYNDIIGNKENKEDCKLEDTVDTIYIMLYNNNPQGGTSYKKTNKRVDIPGIGHRVVYVDAGSKKYIRRAGRFQPLKSARASVSSRTRRTA